MKNRLIFALAFAIIALNVQAAERPQSFGLASAPVRMIQKTPNWGTLSDSEAFQIGIVPEIMLRSFLPHIEEIKKSGHIDDQDKSGRTRLHLAIERNDDTGPRIARALIKAGANPNLQDFQGMTPLHRAIKNRNLLLAIDLGMKTDLGLKNIYDETPLELAQNLKEQTRSLVEKYEFDEIIKKLNQIKNPRSALPAQPQILDQATKKLIDVLSKAIEAHDRKESTAPFHADISRLIKTANIHAKTPAQEGGFTILHLAVQTNDDTIVRWALAAGARSDIRELDSNKRTPEQLAEQLHYNLIAWRLSVPKR